MSKDSDRLRNLLVNLFSTEPPGFIGSWRKEVTVSVGDSLVLECYVRGAPQPVVIWFKDGIKIHMNDRVVLTESRQLLVITEVTDDDGGRYDCEVANSQGNDTRTMMVTIETGMSVICSSRPESIAHSAFGLMDYLLRAHSN